MRYKAVAVVVLVAMSGSPALLAADAPSLTPITCASAAAPVKVVASVPASATSAKVYFKATGQNEYYIDMRRGANGQMWAFLPPPESTTQSFTYRVISTDAKNVQTSTPLMTATTSASCPSPSLNADEQRAANAIVVGLTAANQSSVPAGFQCRGVVSYITIANELRPNDECRRVLAALPGAAGAGAGAGAAAGTAAAGATAGLSTGAIIGLTALGLAGAGAIIVNNNKDDKPVSPARP